MKHKLTLCEKLVLKEKETGDVISEIGHCYVHFVACLGIWMEVLNFKWFKHVTLSPRNRILP